MSGKLTAALTSVDWNKNAAWLQQHQVLASRIEACNTLLALWSRQIERTEKGNVSLSFIREMQHAGHHAACCLGLALYKPAAGAMRSMLECAMYYCFFRTHFSELETLVRDEKYYISKKEILDFFKKHIAGYQKKQDKLGFGVRLEHWYSKTSAIVHGQIPGAWNQGVSVSEFLHVESLLTEAVSHFEFGTLLVRDLFFCTITVDTWAGFSTTSKQAILKGVPGDVKAVLQLDSA